MSKLVVAFLLVFLMDPGLVHAQEASPDTTDRRVVVNGVRLPASVLHALEAQYRVRAQKGAYWYDPACGAWGFAGGPTVGFIPAGLDLGGPLQADASGGTTLVFINGRQLPVRDVLALRQLVGPVLPGRYWLDAQGNVGVEGGPAFMNLAALVQRRARPNSAFYRSGITGIGAGRSGGTSYVIGEDWSVTVE
jgi:hypothetical protein